MPRKIACSMALTARETEVLCLLAEGLCDKAMMARLAIEFSTLRSHLESIFAKLGVNGRLEAARWAWEHGMGPARGA